MKPPTPKFPLFHIFHICLFIFASLFFSSFSLKIGETCSKDTDCEAGLRCETCPINGNTRPRCTSIQPILPTSKVKGLAFNKYSWLTTHNAFAKSGSTNSGTGAILVAPTNQEDTIASQLNNGVRGLMLDMYDFQNGIWLCHSFGGKCYDFTAFVVVKENNLWYLDSGCSRHMTGDRNLFLSLEPFFGVKVTFGDNKKGRIIGVGKIGISTSHSIDKVYLQPAINVLKEIQTFLEANPSEIVTIFIEDYVTSPMGLTKLFNAAGLTKFMFPLSQMPKNGGDWPTVDDMAQKNQRLLVFTSIKSKESSEGIAYNWNYVVENQYGDGGMAAGTCTNRAESPPLNTTTISLVLENYFPDNPNSTETCLYNSAPLIKLMNTCLQQDGKRWPNFIAVDYYQRSDGGGAPEAVNIANGHLACGCDNIAYCKENGKFGSCNVPALAPPPPAALSSSKSPGNPTQSNSADKHGHENLHRQLYGFVFTVIILSIL